MSLSTVFEDGKLIKMINKEVLWDGLFSRATKYGSIVKFVEAHLPNNTICVIPHSDGNNCRTWQHWATDIQPYIDYAKEKNKIFILCTLAQVTEEPGINYLYMPLDDVFFEQGVAPLFPNLLTWEQKSEQLCWRGGSSGEGGNKSLRVRFVEKLYEQHSNIRLSTWWSEGKNIPNHYFANRVHYTEFLKYKIFFIVDGAVIASNHMWGFATGAAPFYISNARCWFTPFLIPYVNHIPVKHDLSDLIEKIEWVKNNDDKAKVIAENALQFTKYYFSAEYQQDYLKTQLDKYK